MTRDEAANALDGSAYGEEGTKEFFAKMKEAGLVAVFGASVDLMEFRGAIHDEVDCYSGGRAYVTPRGLVEVECENYDCPHEKSIRERSASIDANWDDGHGFAWTYTTEIPHAKFIVKEDDELYCEGIVFALADVPDA